MKNKKVFIVLAVCFLLFTLSLLLPKPDSPNPITDIEKKTGAENSETVSLNTNLSLVVTTTEDIEDFKKELYLHNEKLGETELLFKSDMPISLAQPTNGSNLIEFEGLTVFAVYESSKIEVTKDFSYNRNEYGTVYFLDKNGNVEYQYTTENIFDRIEQIDGQVYLFERVLHDPTNAFPRHLKPYYLIKKAYTEKEFSEVDRTLHEPMSELTS